MSGMVENGINEEVEQRTQRNGAKSVVQGSSPRHVRRYDMTKAGSIWKESLKTDPESLVSGSQSIESRRRRY